jgi:hypothetical protein
MEAIASVENAKQFMEGKLSPERTDRVGSAIASTLLGRNYRRRFDALMSNLEDGKPFEQAFQDSFNGTVDEFVAAWLGHVRGG